jgi:hypothetical protein
MWRAVLLRTLFLGTQQNLRGKQRFRGEETHVPFANVTQSEFPGFFQGLVLTPLTDLGFPGFLGAARRDAQGLQAEPQTFATGDLTNLSPCLHNSWLYCLRTPVKDAASLVAASSVFFLVRWIARSHGNES